MLKVQLRTGNTIYVSVYEYYFKLKDEDMDLFFQSCEADNLGTMEDNPFSNNLYQGKTEFDIDVEEDYE